MGRNIYRGEIRLMSLKDVVYKKISKDYFTCYFCNLQKYKEIAYMGLKDQYISHPLMCGNCKNGMEKNGN